MADARSKDVGIDCSVKDFGHYRPYSEKWLVENMAVGNYVTDREEQ